MKAYVKGDVVFVEMPMKIIVYAATNHPDVIYKVRDEAKFAQWIADNILEFDEDESGLGAFYRMMDDLIQEAAESDIIDCEHREDDTP